MRLVLKIFAWLLGLVLLAIGGFAAFVYFGGVPTYDVPQVSLQVHPTPELVARGKDIARMSCFECHMDYDNGRLSGRRMFDVPEVFGTAYSSNITQDPTHGIGDWSDGELAVLLRTGINRGGRYTMPWMPKLPRMADKDLNALIAWLRSDDSVLQATPVSSRGQELSFLAKFLSRVAFKPFAWPEHGQIAPPLTETVEYGRYLVQDFLECYSCHSADFKSVDDLNPPASVGYMGGGNKLLSLDGEIILSANITPDTETGIGSWSEEDFVRAIREGLRPDGRVLRFPMSRRPETTEAEARAIYAYLQTVPPIHNAVERNFVDQGGPALTDGSAIYRKAGCVNCHGPQGEGLGKLSNNRIRFPEDEKLVAWIRNPSAIDPHTRMPAFEGVLQEAEYGPLVGFLREMAE